MRILLVVRARFGGVQFRAEDARPIPGQERQAHLQPLDIQRVKSLRRDHGWQ
jgi:hypothetical protein